MGQIDRRCAIEHLFQIDKHRRSIRPGHEVPGMGISANEGHRHIGANHISGESTSARNFIFNLSQCRRSQPRIPQELRLCLYNLQCRCHRVIM